MRQTVRKNPAECTGCGACVSICPKQAITMQPDAEGFLYPKVDGEKCVSCDLCEKRCPAGREMPYRSLTRCQPAALKQAAASCMARGKT